MAPGASGSYKKQRMGMLLALLGIALLMIVHEAGHYFVARAFGMRVDRFAIGIGPTIWKHQPKNSDTLFLVGLIPFMAYVQIAGLNPFEEVEDDDEGSYANASLVARIAAIIAGPLANYLFASVVFFASFLAIGKSTTEVLVASDTAAEEAGFKDHDVIVSIDRTKIETWRDLVQKVSPSAGKKLSVVVLREGKEKEIAVTPRGEGGRGLLGVTSVRGPMPYREALVLCVEQPAQLVAANVVGIFRMITGKESAQLSGPLGLMRETKKAAESGLGEYLWIVAFLSTAVGFFNMLPVPALDGGRLLFLGYEAVTRRRPNQKVEAQIHMLGMVLLLTTLVLVTYREWGTDKTPSEQAAEARKKELLEKEKAQSSEAGKASPKAPSSP